MVVEVLPVDDVPDVSVVEPLVPVVDDVPVVVVSGERDRAGEATVTPERVA